MAKETNRSFGQTVDRVGIRGAILRDLYHFLIARTWGHLLGLIAIVYVIANVVFALLYEIGGDSVVGARPGNFGDYFFFSVQTMATIGYGTMAPRTLYAHLLVTAEAFVGTLFVAVVTGLVFAKFSRPTARVLFSESCVLVERDGVQMLMFRMANERANQIVEAQLRCVLTRNELTSDGERIRRVHDLELVRERNLVFVLSWTAMHMVTADSPLYGMSDEDLKQTQSFVVCSLTGRDETFAQTVHARHAYTADEIVRGKRFADILFARPDGSRYVDYSKFHELVPMGTPSNEVPR
jgi:inward rectifier potassium channel